MPDIPRISEDDLDLSDISVNDVSITKHGFAPKAPNDTAKFLRGDATWNVPPSGGVVAEFELDANLDIMPTELSGTIVHDYELSPAGIIVADAFFQTDANGDLQPVA